MALRTKTPTAAAEAMELGQLPKSEDIQNGISIIGHQSRPKVILLGLVRTGSTSMWVALQILGYKCSDSTLRSYHMLHESTASHDHAQWHAALQAKYFGKGKRFDHRDWDRLLGNCDVFITATISAIGILYGELDLTNEKVVQAVTDFPAAAFAPELIAQFPDAKIILTTRSTDNWFDSVTAAVVPLTQSPLLSVLRWIDPGVFGSWIPMLRAMMLGMFGPSFEANGRAVYEEHNAMVRNLVPEERLLGYQPGSGWEPLCNFLGHEVPDSEFPRVNDSKAYQERMNEIIMAAIWRAFQSAAALLIGIGAIMWILREYFK